MDGRIMRCGTIVSCQSAATSEIVKRCWSLLTSLTLVSGAIASVQTFTFTFDDRMPARPSVMVDHMTWWRCKVHVMQANPNFQHFVFLS